MRIYRNGIKICIVLCVISLLSLIIVTFDIPTYLLSKCCELLNLLKRYSQINALVYDISLGIFASSFVVLITYIGTYQIEKKNTIGKVKYYCKEYILELANLISMLIKIENGIVTYNWEEVKGTLTHNKDAFNIITQLVSIHNQRLLNIEGFFPILRKNKDNLKIHKLICMLAKINDSVKYCSLAYNIENNSVYKAERADFSFDENEFKKQVDIILPTNNNSDYQEFLELLKDTFDQYPNNSVYNSQWKEKCS